MKVLNTTVIGTGSRAGVHLPIINILHDKYRLIAVCDVDEDKAKTVAQKYNVIGYTDLNEMLDKEKPDVCLIATQAESHHVIARVLAERKIHILTETPIAVTVPCADLMIKTAKENGVFLEVSENVRRWPHERLKRKIVESGIIGDIKEFYLSYTSGSFHGVSGIRAILGTEAVSVVGEFPDDDVVLERGTIQWSEGINGIYEYNKSRGNYWEIIGTKGSIKGNSLYIGELKYEIMIETTGEGPNRTIKRSYVKTEPEISWESPFQNYSLPEEDYVAVANAWCSLYESIVDGEPLDYGSKNAKKDIELIIAIRGSAAENGKRLNIPLTEMNKYEKILHSEFKKNYGIDILDLTLDHLKKKYTLSGSLRELMYYGRVRQ